MITAAQMYSVEKITKRLIKFYSLTDEEQKDYIHAMRGNMAKMEAADFIRKLLYLTDIHVKGAFPYGS